MMEPLPYTGNLPWLRQRAILVVTHGSHAYGLNTPASDRTFLDRLCAEIVEASF